MLMDTQTEIVYQVPMEETNLKCHFNEFFKCFCTENSGRFVSGILSPSINARIGISEAIEDDLQFFREQNMPFCWYIDEESNPGFKQRLLAARFKDLGVFKGMIARLDRSFPTQLQRECTIELVQDTALMNKFAALICLIFSITGQAADQYEQALWERPGIYNWVLKKEGKIIAALSTFIEGTVVSVWNVATDPTFRRQGYCNELWKAALNDAILNGCQTSMTYLTSEGMAYGICKGLGYETKWQFHAYLCP